MKQKYFVKDSEPPTHVQNENGYGGTIMGCIEPTEQFMERIQKFIDSIITQNKEATIWYNKTLDEAVVTYKE